MSDRMRIGYAQDRVEEEYGVDGWRDQPLAEILAVALNDGTPTEVRGQMTLAPAAALSLVPDTEPMCTEDEPCYGTRVAPTGLCSEHRGEYDAWREGRVGETPKMRLL